MLLCNVKESLQYGVPGGLFLFALLMAQLKFELYDYTVLRWVIAIIMTQTISMLSLRSRVQGKLEFRVSWFSGFNVLFISVLSFLILGFVLSGLLESIGTNPLVYNLHVAIMEFFGLMTIGILVTTLLAYVLVKKD